MDEETRRIIVFEAASRVSQRATSMIVTSHSLKRFTIVNPGYDPDTNTTFNSSGSIVYLRGSRNSHMQLIMSGHSFRGVDFANLHHFSGSVKGSAVDIFDYGANRTFKYTVTAPAKDDVPAAPVE